MLGFYYYFIDKVKVFQHPAIYMVLFCVLVYAYNSINICEYHWYQKLWFFNVICCPEYYVFWPGNGIKLFLTLPASIYVCKCPPYRFGICSL